LRSRLIWRWKPMEARIKVRHRSPLPRPWKWEIHIDGRLKTASHESYASQAEAHAAARDVLARITSEANERRPACQG
jgi:hypothetical protein